MDKLEKLQQRVAKTQADLERDEEMHKRLEARQKQIDEAPEWIRTDFWCDTCDEDVLGCRAYKVVQNDDTVPGQKIAFYESYQACHNGLRRRITDKDNDPYYWESQMLREQRQDFAKDLLQPGDPGFSTLYGDPNKKLYERMEAEEKAQWAKNR